MIHLQSLLVGEGVKILKGRPSSDCGLMLKHPFTLLVA